jgi:methylase of polypeptide subunit release factors
LRVTSPTTVPTVTDPQDYQRIRDVLNTAGYTDAGVVKALGVDSLSRLRDRKLPALLRRTSGGTPLETLIRLFILDQGVDRAAAENALAPMTVEAWAEIGLVDVDGLLVRPLVQLRCYQGLVLAYDFPRRGSGGVRPDYVMSVSPSSLVLLGMTVRRTNRAALDLGSGCGIQAFEAARHSERVVGVDCNPRALAMARFNARLNGADNVEFRDGDMFAPVAGETFDLIVSNPPFIISPDSRHLFLNSGTDDDEICRRLAQQAPQFLNDGGFCIFNANWAVVDDENWQARLAGWFDGTGCDAFVIGQGILDIGEYAASLIEIGDDERAEYLRLFDQWMDYYARRRIVGIGRGVIVMRRASGRPNWFEVDTDPTEIAFPCGDDVLQLMEIRTFLQALGDHRDLLNVRLRVAPNVRFEQVSAVDGGSWSPMSGTLRRVNGLAYSGAIDKTTAALLAQYDGRRPVKEHLEDLAATLGTPIDTVVPSVLPILRRLVEQGFLVPADVT